VKKREEHIEYIEVEAIEDSCDGPVINISHFGKDEKCFLRKTFCGGYFILEFKY
jgi:hypothetical protein